MSTTQDDLDELRGLLAKATKRPWHVDGDDYGADIYGPDEESDFVAVDHEGLGSSVRSAIDAALIVAAVNALPALLDELERLRSVRDGGISEEPGSTITLCGRNDCRWQVTGPHYPHGADDFSEPVYAAAPPWLAALGANAAESVPGEGVTEAAGEPDAPCSYQGSWGQCHKWRDDEVHVRPDQRKQRGQHVWRNDR